MLHEQLSAFHQALRFGLGHCPPDLFEGSVPSIVRGLKVHANNVAHVRHVALEETYPRLLNRMGADAFHAAADSFLDGTAALSLPLDALGEGFETVLDVNIHRDLARVEWAWLQSFHAGEAEALTLAALASFRPEELVETRIALHPATRLVRLEEPALFDWGGSSCGNGGEVLLTRPDATVLLRRVDAVSAQSIALLESNPRAGELLGGDPTIMLALIEAGAIYLGDSQ